MEGFHSAVRPPAFQTVQSLIAQPHAAQNLVVQNTTAQNHHTALSLKAKKIIT